MNLIYTLFYRLTTSLLLRRRMPSAWQAGALMLLALGATGNAAAACYPVSSGGSQTPGPHPYNALPASANLNKADIGSNTAFVITSSNSRRTTWSCFGSTIYSAEVASTSLKVWDASKGIYETGIPGVGVRFSVKADSNNWPYDKYIPFSVNTGDLEISLPTVLFAYFVRIGVGVGRGQVQPFDLDVKFTINTNPVTEVILRGTGMTIRLNQSFYYTSCHNATTDPIVKMGRPTIASVKQGNVSTQTFAMDIQCEGMNPSSKPPVKMYFEGNSPGTGRLSLDNAGQAGIAKGVELALTTGDGKTPLPFSRYGALSLRHTDTAPNVETYRFEGKARYVPTGTTEAKAGKADATMTYVLQYN